MATAKAATSKTNEQAMAVPQNNSERFTAKILQEFGNGTSTVAELTDSQKRIIGGYFIGVDRALKKAEEDRVRKNEKNKDHSYDNTLPVTWNTINMPDLAMDLVHYAKMGLDMQQDNMLVPVPYKNNKTGKYDITLMEGYNGKRYIAEKYAIDPPTDITVELVYSTDIFRPIKKSAVNKIEHYEFEISNPFQRGDCIGGFAYIQFKDPSKNRLIIMSVADIEKRKPRYAAAEFWGGMKWEDGKQVQTDGWKEEMYRKTLMREACSSKYIVVDPAKIDDEYQYLKAREARIAEAEAQAEIDENANKIVLDVDLPEEDSSIPATIDTNTGELDF